MIQIESSSDVMNFAHMSEVDMALAGYLARYKNQNTFNLYKYHLKCFVTWCTQQGLHILHDVKRGHIEFYVRHLIEERKLSAATVNSAMTPVKGFYDFAVWDQYIAADPARKIALPKLQYKKSEPLTSRELNLFLETAKHTSPRHWCLCTLLCSMGMRISEAASLDLENYKGLESGSPSLTFVEKGGNLRTMPVPLPVLAAIESARKGRNNGPLLVQLDGKSRLSRGGAAGLVSTVNRRAAKEGLKRNVNPHLLRKMAITIALESNMSIRDVQAFARHADPRTTSRHYDLGSTNSYRHPVHQIASQLSI